jgi:hypothetical protein
VVLRLCLDESHWRSVVQVEPISKIIFCRFQRPLAYTALRTRRHIAHLPPHPSRGSAQRSSELAGKLFLRWALKFSLDPYSANPPSRLGGFWVPPDDPSSSYPQRDIRSSVKKRKTTELSQFWNIFHNPDLVLKWRQQTQDLVLRGMMCPGAIYDLRMLVRAFF